MNDQSRNMLRGTLTRNSWKNAERKKTTDGRANIPSSINKHRLKSKHVEGDTEKKLMEKRWEKEEDSQTDERTDGWTHPYMENQLS